MLSNESKIRNAIEVLEYGEKFNEFLYKFNISVSNLVNELNEVIDCLHQIDIIMKNLLLFIYF
jgi:hypothetical protein